MAAVRPLADSQVVPLEDRLTPSGYPLAYRTALGDLPGFRSQNTYYPRTALLADGGYVAGWSDGAADGTAHVRVFAADGRLLGEPALPFDARGGPKLAANGVRDEFVVVAGDGTNGTSFARYVNGGVVRSNRLFDFRIEATGQPVGLADDGRFAVAYAAGTGADRSLRVRVVEIGPDGSTPGGSEVVLAPAAGAYLSPVVGLARTPTDGALTLAVGWADDTRARVAIVRVVGGAAAGPPVLLDVNRGGQFGDVVAVDVDAAGNVGVAWGEIGVGTVYRVFAPAGTPLTDRRSLVTTATPLSVSVGADAAADFVAIAQPGGSFSGNLTYYAGTPGGGVRAGVLAGPAAEDPEAKLSPNYLSEGVQVDGSAGDFVVTYYTSEGNAGSAYGTSGFDYARRVVRYGGPVPGYGNAVVGRRPATGELLFGRPTENPADGLRQQVTAGSTLPGAAGRRYLDPVTGYFHPAAAGPRQYLARASDTGELTLGDSAGTAAFAWANWSPDADWQDVQAGDFDGNGTTDVVGRAGGDLWVSREVNGTVLTERWERWNGAVEWADVLVGDFDGDGRDDIAGREAGTGKWWVGVSNGSGFTTGLWTTWNPAAGWVDVRVGDFDADGRDDIAGRDRDAGTWWVMQTNNLTAGTQNRIFAWWSAETTWQNVVVGDFNRDGRADLLGQSAESSAWWANLSYANDAGPAFAVYKWGQFPPIALQGVRVEPL
jgi:hypothetical protein